MKKHYLAWLCLLGAWGTSAQTLNSTFQKAEIPNLNTSRLTSSTSLISNEFIPKSTGCIDTLGYPYLKQYVNSQTGFYNYSISPNVLFGQVYKTGATNMSVTGVEFFIGKTTADLNNSVTLKIDVYSLTAGGAPNASLGTVNYTVAATEDTLVHLQRVNFPTAINTTGGIAIVVSSVKKIKVVISDPALNNTYDEQLLYANIGSGFSTVKSLLGNANDFDAIFHPIISYNMDITTFTATPNSACTNTNIDLNAAYSPAGAETNRFLNFYAFASYFNVSGVTNETKMTFPEGLSSPSIYTYINPTIYQYPTAGIYAPLFQYVLGFQSQDCWVQKTTSVTVDTPADATFSYGATSFCESSTNETPTAAVSGIFSATPSGLNFVNTTTGEIDFVNSTPGNYTITHTVQNGVCSSTSTASLAIVTNNADASFTYAQNSYCLNETNPQIILGSGATVGNFSASSTLIVVNTVTGEVDLVNSTAGTYQVTNTIAPSGSCPGDTKTTTVELKAIPIISINPVTPMCETNSAVTLSATPNTGVFSGTGVTGNSFDPTLAGNGIHTIVYSVTESGCSESATISIDVAKNNIPAFSYLNSSYCLNDANPQVILGTGASAGVFTSTSGIILNSSNGTIDLVTSNSGTYVITNTVNAASACPVSTADITIELKAFPAISFTMPATICSYDEAILLNATPAGGTYSGPGVSGGVFNPSIAGVGSHTITYSVNGNNGCSNSEARSILVDECLGVNDGNLDQVKLYPVPATNSVTIITPENSSAQLLSLEGKIIVDNLKLTANSTNVIFTENLARGVYFVKITLNKQEVIKKITLE